MEWKLAFDRVRERTDGTLDIRVSPQGELPIKGPEQLRAVSTGEIEMFMMFGGYHRGDAPILSTTDIPYTWHNMLEKVKVFYATYPIIESELNKMNIHVFPIIRGHDRLALLMNQPIDIMDANKLKIRSYGTAVGMVIEAMNGVATPLAWAESFTAIERGTVNGILTGLGALYRAAFYEVAPYGYDIAYLSNIIWPCVNLEKWNSLPREVQDILADEIIRAGVTNIARNPVYEAEHVELMSSALESWYSGPPPQAFFEKMRANVTEPLFIEAVDKLGTVGEQMLAAIEGALEREIVK